MKKILLLIFLYFSCLYNIKSQNFVNSSDVLVNGYAAKISGTDYQYHSFIPDLKESILIRATDGTDFMEWETDVVKAIDDNKDYYSFIWVAAIGSGPGKADFKAETSKNDVFTFYSDGNPEWEIKSENASFLKFKSIWIDQYGDHHGYMQLRMPNKNIKPNEKLKIKITGGKKSLSSWYMTYRKEIKNTLHIKALPAIIKDGNQLKQLATASIFYFGNETMAKFYVDNKLIINQKLVFGHNYIRLKIDPVNKSKQIVIRSEIDNNVTETKVLLEAVKKWEINFVQHSHTDIGYTRSQTEILAEHLRYIDYALDYCDATDNYPENAKFRWVCEASWAVDEYLKTRPQSQIDRLKKRVKEGRIEVTAMYYNFSELPDESQMAASLDALSRIKNAGIDVKLAMQNDVNGIAWCLNDYFSPMNVKYLNMGTHGHRALICFDKPGFFWWESPSGNKMLAFRAEHYMTGNTVFEIQSGDINKFTDKMLGYLTDLQNKNYPYNEISIQHSGYLTDNSPPSTTLSELIKQWNDIYEYPKLTTATATAFFEKMEKKYADNIPTIKGYWPDWWADGLGASAREVAVCRNASASFNANTSALAMAELSGLKISDRTKSNIKEAQEAMLFYTEHTTGYSESVREPLSLGTMEQRALKDSYAWEANRRVASIGEESMGLLQSLFKKEKQASLVIFNTLNWKRNALATVYIDHQIVGVGKKAIITDKSGRIYPTQAVSSRSDGTYWAVYLKDIPAFGYKKFFIQTQDELKKSSDMEKPFIENEWYKIDIDYSKAVINSIYDKESAVDLVDKSAKIKLGEFILEQLGNRSQLESFKLNSYQRKALDKISYDGVYKGDIWDAYRFIGESETVENPRGFIIEFRVFKTEKRIDVNIQMIKKNITDPESFYIAFPFVLNNAVNYSEVAGGVVVNGKDQIKGSSSDWAVIQGFTAIRNASSQIVMNCNEMPLVQFGNINTGRFKAGAMPETTHIYSWPMNNYWTTNFNADQRGGHNWTYNFTSFNNVSNIAATQFGWNCRVPLLSRVISGGGDGDKNMEGQFIGGFPENVLLISTLPIENDFIKIQIRELEGKKTSLNLINTLNNRQINLIETDAAGNRLKTSTDVLKPLETKFYIISIK